MGGGGITILFFDGAVANVSAALEKVDEDEANNSSTALAELDRIFSDGPGTEITGMDKKGEVDVESTHEFVIVGRSCNAGAAEPGKSLEAAYGASANKSIDAVFGAPNNWSAEFNECGTTLEKFKGNYFIRSMETDEDFVVSTLLMLA